MYGGGGGGCHPGDGRGGLRLKRANIGIVGVFLWVARWWVLGRIEPEGGGGSCVFCCVWGSAKGWGLGEPGRVDWGGEFVGNAE